MMIEPWTTTVSSWQSLTFRSHSGNFLQATGYIHVRTVQHRCILQVSHWRSSILVHMQCILHRYIRSALSMHHTDTCYQFCSLANQIQTTSAVWLFRIWLVETINLAHLCSWGTSELLGSTTQLRSPPTTITVKYIRHTSRVLHFKVISACSWIKLACHKRDCITFYTKKLPEFYNNQSLQRAFSYTLA